MNGMAHNPIPEATRPTAPAAQGIGGSGRS